ncbi:MAG TPA: type II toxin-antitoxin system HicB family antitoxin [Acidobacteriota bacterium]|nr:type II toxin-antitoxin system HicB family antitoxin [Acidobacteriota bacterium]
MITYPALFVYDEEEKVYNVRFPDLPGCFTYGETIDEAKAMAKEALTGFLQSVDARKLRLPDPSRLKGDEVIYIEPETPVAFAIWLRKQREALGLSQSDVAKKLGIKYQTYQRIESPSKTNPTLKTIMRVEKVFNQKLVKV